MAEKTKNRTQAGVQTYSIKAINRRIRKAEAELRHLRAVKAVLTKSPGQAVVITTVYPQNECVQQEEYPDIKVEMTCPLGDVAIQMRQTEQQFSETNGKSNFGKQRAVVRVATHDCFGQVEIPRDFWAP